jgi:hypothetical protein
MGNAAIQRLPKYEAGPITVKAGSSVPHCHGAGPRQLAGSDGIGRSYRRGAAVDAGALPAETAPRLRPRTITPVSALRRGPAQRD